MGAKGVNVVVDPQVLIAAITVIRMGNDALQADAMELKAAMNDMLNSGMVEGERMTKQKELIQSIITGCDNTAEVIGQLSGATQKIYDKYISAETKAMIDNHVAQAMEKLQAAANREALKKK